MKKDANIPIVPGRGLTTPSAIRDRLDFMAHNNIQCPAITSHHLELNAIKQLIESFIGSVELPVGLVGPLLWKDKNGKAEWVYCSPATLEGALIYSMNRGVKVLSKSGGVQTAFYYQKMVRAPLFIMKNKQYAQQLSDWIKTHFDKIKIIAESYSNHGKLLSIESVIHTHHVHTRFYYTTGDASGQNLSTTCTWHALLYIEKEFNTLFPGAIEQYVIEGNGASDKKISQYAIAHGRGCKVSAQCEVSNEILKSLLRIDADSFMRFYKPSIKLAQKDGMLGFSINAANAIAAIFAATGQDLACIHESSTAYLQLSRTPQGILFQLDLPNLVIGTVGGGTQLPKQAEALHLMGCNGNGKLERFAQLIAAFTLGLEISTFGAIVSGEFAKAHEKLGRNKPVNWLLKSEITPAFLHACFYDPNTPPFTFVNLNNSAELENGIITQLSQKVSKKLQGYYLLQTPFPTPLLLKIRPPSDDVIKGIHLLSVAIDAQLSDLLLSYRQYTPFHNCHIKEISANRFLHDIKFPFAPMCFGDKLEDERMLYVLFKNMFHLPKHCSLMPKTIRKNGANNLSFLA